MAWSQADIDALKQAIATGATEVVLPDRTVRFRSLAEMRQTLGLVEAEVAGAGRARVKAIRFQTDKGIP
jgi:hypothetical protein